MEETKLKERTHRSHPDSDGHVDLINAMHAAAEKLGWEIDQESMQSAWSADKKTLDFDMKFEAHPKGRSRHSAARAPFKLVSRHRVIQLGDSGLEVRPGVLVSRGAPTKSKKR